jgi:RecA/RadA recombinase
MSPVMTENLERDIEIIRKKRGPKAIYTTYEEPPIYRIPFDSPGLNRITSGGIPLGRITRFWGGPMSSKSLLAWQIVRKAREMDLAATWWDIERQVSKEFAEKMGCKGIHIETARIIEDITRELQLLLGSVHLHVLDSCSEAIPQDRCNKDPADWHIGLDIRVWNKCWEYIMSAMDKNENSIIAIDHAKSTFSPSSPGGRISEKPLGGKEIEHHSSLSLHMKNTKWLYYDEEGMLQTEDKLKDKGIIGFAGKPEPDGMEVVVRTSKSRVCTPFKIANLRLDFKDLEFDHTFELMQGAEYFDKMGGLAHRSGQPAIAHRAAKQGGWVSLPSGEKIQGERALRQRIEQDIDLQRLIRRAMLQGN